MVLASFFFLCVFFCFCGYVSIDGSLLFRVGGHFGLFFFFTEGVMMMMMMMGKGGLFTEVLKNARK